MHSSADDQDDAVMSRDGRGRAPGRDREANGEPRRAWPPLRPRRVLFFGKTKARTRCTAALVDALERNGVEVKWLNCSFLKRYFTRVGMRLLARSFCRRYDPDLIFIFYHDLPRDLMAEFSREVPTVVWMEELIEIADAHVDYVRDARLLCLSTPRLVREYRSRGITNSTFLLSGFSPMIHAPVELPPPATYDREIAFIGGPGVKGDRPEFLSWLSTHHDVEIFGIVEAWLPVLHRFPNLRFGREVRPSDYGEICARSKIVLGLNQDHDNAFYFSNRLFLTLACRGFHLIRYVPGTEQLFGNRRHLVWFRDRDECLEQVSHYLGHDDERRAIAAAGHDLVQQRHRYEDRVADILAILAGEQPVACPDDPLAAGRSPVGEEAFVLQPAPARSNGVLEVEGQPARRISGAGG